VQAGLQAYERGDFFLAHELMEPAWMGASDPSERALIQGMIKLAAAEVHRVRGNPVGVSKNLEGARAWLRRAADAGRTGPEEVDLSALLATIESRIADPTDAAELPIDLPLTSRSERP